MFLVHRGKQNPNRWEVAWTWLPYFLAADQLLHRHVDKAMTAKWKGTENPSLHEVKQMHEMVVALILERYPIEGLRTYLSAILAVQLADGAVPTPPEAKEESRAVRVDFEGEQNIKVPAPVPVLVPVEEAGS